MSALGDVELYFGVKTFQALEASLLQAAAYDEWLKLLAPEIRYRVPVVSVSESRSETEAKENELAHYDDNLESLKMRVARMKSRVAWSEIPPSRVRYFVEPLSIDREGEMVRVVSNVMVYQTRLQREENYFVGHRRDRLRRGPEGFLLVERIAVIDKTVLPGKNLTVFF